MAATIPTSNSRIFWAAQTVLIFSGTQTQAAVGDVRLRWGYRIHEELTTGTNLPYLGTGGFHGEADFETLGSSDSRWEGMVAIVSGIVPTFGQTWQERDTEGIGASGNRTWTISGKCTEYEKRTSKDGVVLYKLKIILSNEPTVTQS